MKSDLWRGWVRTRVLLVAVLFAFAVMAYATTPPEAHAGGTYTPDEMLVVLGFTVEVSGAGSGSDVDSAWETCTGGSLSIEVADASTGTDQFHQTTPGHKYVDTLNLRGPLTSGLKELSGSIVKAVEAAGEQKGSATYDLLESGAGRFKIEMGGCPGPAPTSVPSL